MTELSTQSEKKGRGRPKGSTKQPESNTLSSGIAYVYDNGFVQWSDPKLNIDTIKRMMRNPYLRRPVTQLMNLLFPHGDPVITVQDQDEHEDEEAAKKLRQMFRTKDCNIKKMAKRCWLSWFYWGAFVYNVVYEKGKDAEGWRMIKAIRHLPAETFSHYSISFEGMGDIQIVSKGELLPGIARYSDGNLYYSQTNYNGISLPLKNVTHVPPPNDLSGDPAGMPICYVALSLIELLNYAWACQRQRLARVGAPSIFLIVTDPQERIDSSTGRKINDLEYAQDVLKNWGRNNLFPLLGNMQAVPVPSNESDSAMETIDALAKLINDQWSPIGLISTEGSQKIGGGDEAGLDLLRSFRSGYLDPIAEIFVEIGEDWLDFNGYNNYSVYIRFPEFDPKNGELDLRRAQEGRAARVVSRNEHRALLGLEYATEEDLDDFYEEWGGYEDESFPGIGGEDNVTAKPNDTDNGDNTKDDTGTVTKQKTTPSNAKQTKKVDTATKTKKQSTKSTQEA